MKNGKLRSSSLFTALFLAFAASFYGCATTSNTESLLSAAGFRSRTPTTRGQIAMFNAMTPNRIERRERHGKVLYTYADKQRDLVYIGGEGEYQRYKNLGLKQQIAQENLDAAQINQEAYMEPFGPEFGPYWGPWNVWW